MAPRMNDEVLTPVGRGVVQGQMDGRILVRVALSGSITDNRCITPRGRKSSLWVFDPGDLKAP